MQNHFYKKVFNQIEVSDDMNQKLLYIPKNRSESRRVRKFRLLPAVAIACLIFSVIPVAAAIIHHIESNAVQDSLTSNYANLEEVKKDTGLNFPCPKKIGSDYEYFNSNVNEDKLYDEANNQIGVGTSVHVSYMNEENTLVYDVDPKVNVVVTADNNVVESSQIFTEQDEYGAEVNYTFTEEIVSTEDHEDSNLLKITWSDEQNDYCLSGYNVKLTADELFLLASDIRNDR